MTQFKHIIVLVLMLLTFGFAAKAQSTTRRPYEGAMHAYTCNGISVGAGYNFYITANADGSGKYDDGLTGEFDFIDATTGIVGGDGLASTQIQWNNGASAHIYYLWLEASFGNGCSNLIHIEVTPQVNQFDLLSENVPVDNITSCPAIAATDGFNPLASAYNAGSSILQFVVKRENGNNDWSFIPQLLVDPDLVGLNNQIVSIKYGSGPGDILTADLGGRYMVPALYDAVSVTVSVQNAPGDHRAVMLQVTMAIESNTNLTDSDPTNNNVTHIIKVMPVIGGMGGV